MTDKKIDITSTVLEKGIDIAKNFLDKLIVPAVEETGLLLKDKVTLWKFKNQVRMLNKAKEYCEKNNISTKTISLKILCPLLDNAALEEDDILQDKWSILLSNLVDSDQNIENHVFPYILGQISSNEFLFLEKELIDKKERIKKLKIELRDFQTNRPKYEEDLKNQIDKIDIAIDEKKRDAKHLYSNEMQNLQKSKKALNWQLESLKYKEASIIRRISEPQVVSERKLREFEVSNLTRLGVIKIIQETYANSQTLEIPNNPEREYLKVDLEIDVESNIDHILTELGELFIEACTEKRKKSTLNSDLGS